MVAEMSPFLLFGFFVAGLLSLVVSQRMVERHLGGRGIMPLLKASILGVPLPLCSCGVIPVSMSLRKHGASKGATISFLLSTPQTGVDSILVTLSLLGPVFAVFRPVAALVTGLVGGLVVDLTERGDGDGEQEHRHCEEPCCTGGPVGRRFVAAMRYAFITLPQDIGRALLVGIAVAAVISAVVPDDYFADKLGHPLVGMVVMMLVGIPVYVCATASVPVAAALIIKGLSPGAALVFLMTGPATNAASFATIWKGLGKRAALAYLGSVAACAMAGGLVLDMIATKMDLTVVSRAGWMLPEPAKNIFAVALVGILIYGALSKSKNRHGNDAEVQTSQEDKKEKGGGW